MTPKYPNPLLSSGEILHGFSIARVSTIPEIRSVAYLAEHNKSGLRLIHLHSSDPENLFAIGFRTIPPDDSGLPHILEHTVLCGSRRYPVKDPFVELLKTSLATFLNAMTYPDRTIYPCASLNHKDFFNLARVYCDAVFYPAITPRHFKQEGHHLEFSQPGNTGSPLIVKGVVFNEMKGVYSDLDGIIGREIPRNLFPDNAYGRDYGGNPRAITALTYDQFKEYHRRWYHPSNALIFLYGDIPITRHLEFLNSEYLKDFDRDTINAAISIQKNWISPRRVVTTYPISPSDDPGAKAAVVAVFRAGENSDPVRSLALHILSHYLLSNAASPLRKALIDSHLGEELTDSGYYSHQRDCYFEVGLKGTESDRADQILDLIRETCVRIVTEGMDAGKIESAFHRLEMSSLEIKSMYPLRLMDHAFESWSSTGDPMVWFPVRRYIEEVRKSYQADPEFFARMLNELIIDNSHQLLLSFIPDPEYMAKLDKAEAFQMEEVKKLFNEDELEAIDRESAELEIMQSTPNSPEALATLPRLSLPDVPAEPRELKVSHETLSGRPFLVTDMFSNGLSYIAISFDLRGLDETAVPYLSLFPDVLAGMGAGNYDYAKMAEREASCSGGIEPDILISGTVDDPRQVRPTLTIFCRALDRKLPEMLEIFRERLLLCDLTDRERLKNLILQERMERKSRVVQAGNSYAVCFASRGFSGNCALNERLKGIAGIRFLDYLVERFDYDYYLTLEKLTEIRSLIQNRRRVSVSVLGSDDSIEIIRRWTDGLLSEMDDWIIPEMKDSSLPGAGRMEGISVPAEIAFVARSQPAVAYTDPAAPALFLLSKNISYGYLWEEVRVKGGAYGCGASYDPARGTFSLSSYRDPGIADTLRAYSGIFDYIEKKMDLSQSGVEQAIIGAVKYLDRPIRPEQAVDLALHRHLAGRTPEKIKEFRQRLFNLDGDAIRKASSEILRSGLKDSSVCVITSRERLEAANRVRDDKFAISDL